MPEIGTYQVLFYGNPAGSTNTSSADIHLNSTAGQRAATVRFYNPNSPPPNDSVINGIIFMYLPAAMFQGVLDVLRNEKPVFVTFTNNYGYIHTLTENVGEDDLP